MKVRYGEDVASHCAPESCITFREGGDEALTGETGRPAIEPRNYESGMPTLSIEAEGHTVQDVKSESCTDPARSETLSMRGSFLDRSWEISSVPAQAGGTGKVKSRTPVIYAVEKSDSPIVPQKLPNKGFPPAEAVEGRGGTKGNAEQFPASRTQCRTLYALMGLEGIREVARRKQRERFTALLHHVTPRLLAESFYALKRQAAAGVDGVTWQDYEKMLEGRVHELHREIQSGRYRAQPSRRVMIPKTDGRQRPLGIASVEDKVVQQAIGTSNRPSVQY